MVMTNSLLLNMAIKIVRFPCYKMVTLQSCVSLPEYKYPKMARCLGNEYDFPRISNEFLLFWLFDIAGGGNKSAMSESMIGSLNLLAV